jgi:hypothetical protein
LCVLPHAVIMTQLVTLPVFERGAEAFAALYSAGWLGKGLALAEFTPHRISSKEDLAVALTNVAKYFVFVFGISWTAFTEDWVERCRGGLLLSSDWEVGFLVEAFDVRLMSLVQILWSSNRATVEASFPGCDLSSAATTVEWVCQQLRSFEPTLAAQMAYDRTVRMARESTPVARATVVAPLFARSLGSSQQGVPRPATPGRTLGSRWCRALLLSSLGVVDPTTGKAVPGCSKGTTCTFLHGRVAALTREDKVAAVWSCCANPAQSALRMAALAKLGASG